MSNKICCILNVAPHYNASIYKLMDDELNCDFYIGDKIHLPIHLMNYNELNGFKGVLKYVPVFGNFYWQSGSVGLIFKQYSVYVIIGEPFCLSTWLLLLLSKFFNKNIILWTHGWYGNETRLKGFVKKVFYGFADQLFLYGNYAKGLMINEGFKPDKLTCVYNSMDYQTQLMVRNSLKISSVYNDFFKNDFPVIIFVGRLLKSKKIDFLIQAVAELNSTDLQINLVVVGDNVEGFNLSKIINDYKIQDKIWMYGPCFDENVLGDLFYNADICVSPGGIGLTAIHSLMYGTPVITHDNFGEQGPEFEAIDEGVSGAFFKEDNIEDMKSKIREWVKNHPRSNQTKIDKYRVVDEKYNPYSQIKIIKSYISNKIDGHN